MAAKDRWYQHVPPATAVVPCEGEEHHVTWRWGKLKLEDHDLGAERAMLTLGGEPAPCLRALQLWADQFGMRPEQFAQLRGRAGADAVLLPKELDVPREVGMTISLERAWKASRYFDQQGILIERRLKELVLPALRAHLNAEKQRIGSRIIRGAALRHVPAGQPLGMEGRMDSVSVSATVTVSSAWVVDVWARGIAVVDGAFVLAVLGPAAGGGGAAKVKAVRWRPKRGEPNVAEPAVITAEAVPAADGWTLIEPDSPG
jgi:hypothetical protein